MARVCLILIATVGVKKALRPVVVPSGIMFPIQHSSCCGREFYLDVCRGMRAQLFLVSRVGTNFVEVCHNIFTRSTACLKHVFSCILRAGPEKFALDAFVLEHTAVAMQLFFTSELSYRSD